MQDLGKIEAAADSGNRPDRDGLRGRVQSAKDRTLVHAPRRMYGRID